MTESIPLTLPSSSHPWTIPLEWLIAWLLTIFTSFRYTHVCWNSSNTNKQSLSSRFHHRNKCGVVHYVRWHLLCLLVTLIIKMHLFRQKLPWFMPGKAPQTPAYRGWVQSGRQHFTYLCHSSPMQSLSCQWEKKRTLQRWFLSSKEEEVSKLGRMNCPPAESVCLHCLCREHRLSLVDSWGSRAMNTISHANLETMACCCHSFNSFMLRVSLRKKVYFLNCFSRIQLFPGLFPGDYQTSPKPYCPCSRGISI